MSFALNTASRRIAFAIGISLLLHGMVLWGPNIHLPHFKSSLPPLQAKLEALPATTAHPKPKRNVRAAPKPEAKPEPQPAQEEKRQITADEPAAASEVMAASAVPAAETAVTEAAVERVPLPRRAQLIFTVNKGTGSFKIGEVMHTLEIDDGHYMLRSETETTGLAKLFKTYRITQYSSGNYSRHGLEPEQFFEERGDKLTTLRHTAEFDRAARRVHFSSGGEAALPPDTQDILSILYQFPPLAHTESVAVSVCNGKKVERYEFEIATDETLHTDLGDLNTVHLRKLHGPDEEGLEVWLAPEYRLFPVKLRFIERNGEVSGEVIITSIHAEFEEETKPDVNH